MAFYFFGPVGFAAFTSCTVPIHFKEKVEEDDMTSNVDRAFEVVGS